MSPARRPAAVLVSPVMPAPGQSGRAWRAWQWLQDLSAEQDVHLVVVDGAGHLTDALTDNPPADPPAVSLHRAATRPQPGGRALRCLGLAAPWLAGRWPALAADAPVLRDPQALAEDLQAEIGAARLQRLVVFRQYLAGCGLALAARLAPQRLELDLDDLESATRRSVAGALWRLGQPLEAALMRAAAAQYRALERRLASPWQQLWLASPDDVERLRGRLPAARTDVRLNRLAAAVAPAPPAPAPLHPAAGPARLLFVGSLDYPPNQEGVLWLVERVLPALSRLAGPAWQLDVVGRAPPAWLHTRLAAAAGVCLHADPPQLAPFYQAARLALVPLHSGGGTKVKTLEAIAHGRAVVSTGEGLRGLALAPGRDCLRADRPEAFAAAIQQLLERPALATRLARAAQQAVYGASKASNVAM